MSNTTLFEAQSQESGNVTTYSILVSK